MLQIHEKIEQARVSAGLTQDELAEKIGVSRSTYQGWEQKTPALDKVMKVAKALNLPKEYFFGAPDPSDKLAAHDALFSVVLDEIASLRSLATGENVTLIKLRLQKAAEDAAKLMTGA